jgi:hypothetical protein
VQSELSPQGLRVLGEARQEFVLGGILAQLLAQHELCIGQVEHGIGVGLQLRVALEVVLDPRPLAAPPAPPLVLFQQCQQADDADIRGGRRRSGGQGVIGGAGSWRTSISAENRPSE